MRHVRKKTIVLWFGAVQLCKAGQLQLLKGRERQIKGVNEVPIKEQGLFRENKF